MEAQEKQLNEELQRAQRQSCSNLFDLLKACKELFKDDALGRLRLIAWLHDFEHIDTSISRYERELDKE